MFNTGCDKILNGLKVAVSIVDAEDKGYALTVAARNSADFKSVIFPWCNNGAEVLLKAFRLTSLRSGNILYWLYQDYSNDHICYTSSDGDRYKLWNKLLTDAGDGRVREELDVFRDLAKNVWDNKQNVKQGNTSTVPLAPSSAINIAITQNLVWGFPASNENTTADQIIADINADLPGILDAAIGAAA